MDATAGLDRLDGKCGSQMCLAGAGWPKKVDGLGTVDDGQLGQRQDALSVERRLKGKVEAGERLDGGEPGHGLCQSASLANSSGITMAAITGSTQLR